MRPVVAVIDSSEEIAALLCQALEHEGFCTAVEYTTAFKHGRADLDAFLAEHDPAALIWDIAIPYEENWAFFREVVASEAVRARRFLVTTTNKRALETLVGPTSAHEIIGKPFDIEALLESVRRLVQEG
jgi:DNA-binding response OmpR family regulator